VKREPQKKSHGEEEENEDGKGAWNTKRGGVDNNIVVSIYASTLPYIS